MRTGLARLLSVCVVFGASAFPLAMPVSAVSPNGPSAALRHHVPHGTDIVQAMRAGSLRKAAVAPSPNSGFACPAERSAAGNVQVNCRAEDAAFPPSAQNETTVSVDGSKVVVGFNDDLVCCDVVNFDGYSVS